MTLHSCWICDRQPADFDIGIRARYKSDWAAWAPNMGLSLCKGCVENGAKVEISYRPTTTLRVEARINLPNGKSSTISHPIGKGGRGPAADKPKPLFE